jgi:DNA adenine methylase
MNPFFCRIGSKRLLANKIIKYIPKHNIYVEAFAGSASVFFRKDKVKKNILNDLDKNLIDGYRLLKKASSNPEDYNIPNGVKNIQKLVDNVSSSSSIEDRLLQKLYLMCNTFGSRGLGKIFRGHNQKQKINKIQDYINKLKNTMITNKDYKIIIKKYDSPDTFFFLDPPYEKSVEQKLYEDGSMDFEEFKKILDEIDGFFLLTINDSPYIRRLFKDYVIVPIKVKAMGNLNLGTEDRNELIIMNYEL